MQLVRTGLAALIALGITFGLFFGVIEIDKNLVAHLANRDRTHQVLHLNPCVCQSHRCGADTCAPATGIGLRELNKHVHNSIGAV